MSKTVTNRNAEKLKYSLISLSNNESGYTVIDCHELTEFLKTLVTQHISHELDSSFCDLTEATFYAATEAFEKFKDKSKRILKPEAASLLLEKLEKIFVYSRDIDLVTDEERLGYANVYWRLVRANSSTDVGSVHADRWFWDLGHGSITNEFMRVKIWIPLIQNDNNPSLLVLPGSHNKNYNYSAWMDEKGKLKPKFNDINVIKNLVPAPIKIGQAIVFHDSLIHGGQTTEIDRVSIEWTFGIKVKN